MLPLLLACLLAPLPSLGQDLTCPTGTSLKPHNFLVIGSSGGDSKAACENTALATVAGLAKGINAVELDISMSRDRVLFLWNDPNPLDPATTARSQGLFVNGVCWPRIRGLTSARGQVFTNVLENFGYVNSIGEDQEVVIPTLQEWMNQFANNDALKIIILDIKVEEVEQADYIVEHIMNTATPPLVSKLRLLSSSPDMAAALQTSLARAGWPKDIASRVLGGTIGTIHLGYESTSGYDPVERAVEDCYSLASVGQSVSSNGWREYQEIVRRMVATRDKQAAAGNKYIPVLAWRVNSVEKMAWLMCQGVDGVYTDEPRQLSVLAQRQQLGDIVCCDRDLKMDCLNNADGRITGQGCSSLGLSWHDQVTEPCPLLPFPLDFFNSGTQLTCRQSRFARPNHDAQCN